MTESSAIFRGSYRLSTPALVNKCSFSLCVFRIKEHERLANKSKLEEKKEREEIQALTKLYQSEMQEKEQAQREAKVKRRQAHLVCFENLVTK